MTPDIILRGVEGALLSGPIKGLRGKAEVQRVIDQLLGVKR